MDFFRVRGRDALDMGRDTGRKMGGRKKGREWGVTL
jgi:hypothetical protein